MEILEIGPSYNPVAAKAKGWNCFSIDHDDQANPRLKYKDQPVDTSRIEAVDFIWREGPLDEVIPPEHLGTFDACIASHVPSGRIDPADDPAPHGGWHCRA